jgi:fumarate reductase flavoprotein subunit
MTFAEAEAERALLPFTQPVRDLTGLRDRLLDTMWEDAGIIRDATSLARASSALSGLGDELASSGIADGMRAFNLTWHDWLNLASQIKISRAVTAAALARENSRGAHFRADFPSEGDLATSAFTVVAADGAGLTVSQRPVAFTRVRPGESLLDRPPVAAE